MAQQLGAIPIWFHTPPGLTAQPVASAHDQIVDDQIADLFRLRADAPREPADEPALS